MKIIVIKTKFLKMLVNFSKSYLLISMGALDQILAVPKNVKYQPEFF